MVVGPVLVTAEAPKTAKLSAEPSMEAARAGAVAQSAKEAKRMNLCESRTFIYYLSIWSGKVNFVAAAALSPFAHATPVIAQLQAEALP
jgi:hypothetical protein